MTFKDFVTRYPISAELETGIGLWHADCEQLTQVGKLHVPVHAILLVLNGALCIRIKNEEMVLTAGYYSDLLPHSQLYILSAVRQTEVWYLFFEDKSFQKIFRNRPPITMTYIDYIISKKVILLSPQALRTLNLCLESLYDTLLSEEFPTRVSLLENKLKIFFLEVDHLFATLLEKLPPEPTQQQARHQFLFSQFVALLHKHARTAHTVEFYASQLCITTQYLGRIVRNIAQQKVYTFISYAVIGEIELLLADLSLTLKQIAAQMHFTDQATFTKFYKRHTGQTPLQFRNRLK